MPPNAENALASLLGEQATAPPSVSDNTAPLTRPVARPVEREWRLLPPRPASPTPQSAAQPSADEEAADQSSDAAMAEAAKEASRALLTPVPTEERRALFDWPALLAPLSRETKGRRFWQLDSEFVRAPLRTPAFTHCASSADVRARWRKQRHRATRDFKRAHASARRQLTKLARKREADKFGTSRCSVWWRKCPLMSHVVARQHGELLDEPDAYDATSDAMN